MRFRVFHRTRYLYRAPVRDSYNELRLRPATDDKSRLEFFLLKIHPPALSVSCSRVTLPNVNPASNLTGFAGYGGSVHSYPLAT
jgi:transglutaminase-like putative cysteine protease